MPIRPPMHLKHADPSLKVRWSVPSRRYRRAVNLFVGASLVLMVSLLVGIFGCQQQVATPSKANIPGRPGVSGDYVAIPSRPKRPLARLDHEPIVRVRIAKRKNKITVNANSDLIVGPGPSQTKLADAQRLRPPLTITKHATGYAITQANGQAFAWGLEVLQITTQGNLQINGINYPGMVMIHHSKPTRYDPKPNTLDAINHVAVETYLPGVLEKELYSRWHPVTFTVQAIAARSYAIVQHFANAKKHFELEAGTASQAYVGANASLKSRTAVAQTRGMVLVYNKRIVPGYYSSCCGGAGQDAAIAFPHGENIPPLKGKLRAAWCNGSKKFRWGPISRDRAMLSKRIASWGHANERSIASISTITSIQITMRNAAHRPAQFVLTDNSNRRYKLGPEEFRFACNYNRNGSKTLSKLSSKQRLYSSHITVQRIGDTVQFSDGRGFGHGVGMCQFGAQGMAIAGLQPEQILQTYYPSSKIQRAY